MSLDKIVGKVIKKGLPLILAGGLLLSSYGCLAGTPEPTQVPTPQCNYNIAPVEVTLDKGLGWGVLYENSNMEAKGWDYESFKETVIELNRTSSAIYQGELVAWPTSKDNADNYMYSLADYTLQVPTCSPLAP